MVRILYLDRPFKNKDHECTIEALAKKVHPLLIYRDDYIPLLLACFDVPMGIRHLLQRIASINYSFHLPCFDQVLEEIEIRLIELGCFQDYFFASIILPPSSLDSMAEGWIAD